MPVFYAGITDDRGLIPITRDWCLPVETRWPGSPTGGGYHVSRSPEIVGAIGLDHLEVVVTR